MPPKKAKKPSTAGELPKSAPKVNPSANNPPKAAPKNKLSTNKPPKASQTDQNKDHIIPVKRNGIAKLNILDPLTTLRKFNAEVIHRLQDRVRPGSYVDQSLSQVYSNLAHSNDDGSYLLYSDALHKFLGAQKGSLTGLSTVVMVQSLEALHAAEPKPVEVSGKSIVLACKAHIAAENCLQAFNNVPSEYGSLDTTLDQQGDFVQDLQLTVAPLLQGLSGQPLGPMLIAGLVMKLLDRNKFDDLCIDHCGKERLDSVLHGALWEDYTNNDRAWQPYFSLVMAAVRIFRTCKYGGSTLLWNSHTLLIRCHRYYYARFVVPKVAEAGKLPREIVDIIQDFICSANTVSKAKKFLTVGCLCTANNVEQDRNCGGCKGKLRGDGEVSKESEKCGCCHCIRNFGPWDDIE